MFFDIEQVYYNKIVVIKYIGEQFNDKKTLQVN